MRSKSALGGDFRPLRAKKKPRKIGAFPRTTYGTRSYLSAVCTEVKVVFSFEPRPETTVMIATEMPAAIRPYSMAVAPLSSCAKRAKSFFMIQNSIGWPLGQAGVKHHRATIPLRTLLKV